jgi:uncharacterized protein YbjT (DUF2867 family)
VSNVLVTGGSGVLGRRLVTRLQDGGHDVRVLSRRREGGTHLGDLATGGGVRDALAGVELVVHAASDTPQGRSDLRQTRTLLDAARHVRHLLYVSIVGIDAMPYGYYGRKLACERAVAAGSVQHTIFRATQFHELLAQGLRAAGRLPVAPLPLGWQVQPVAADEVAERIAELIAADPAGRAEDFGGPEVLDVKRVLEVWRGRHRRPRAVLHVPVPGRTSRALRQGLNTTPQHAGGRQTWADFVGSSSVAS